MPGNRFSLTVRVSCEINFICFFYFLPKLRKDISLAPDRNIFRFIIIFHINSELALRKISHVSVGRVDLICASQEFFNCFNLCRRLYNHKTVRHILHILLQSFRFFIVLIPGSKNKSRKLQL